MRIILSTFMFLVAVSMAFGAERVIPLVSPGSPIYIQNGSDSLEIITVGDDAVILLPHEIFHLTATQYGVVRLNIPDRVHAWSVVDGVVFQSVQASKKAVLPLTTFTGLALTGDGVLSLEVYDGTWYITGMSGKLTGDTFAYYVTELFRYPFNENKTYTLVITGETDFVVTAAELIPDSGQFIAVPVQRFN